MMKIILQEDVPNLGVVGDLVSVRDGYARNYLIPQGKATFASVRSVRQLDHQKRLAAHHRKQATAVAEQQKQQVEGLSVVMKAKVAPPPLGEDGEPIQELLPKLFGSITNRDITKVLKDSGIQIPGHRRVTLKEHVRTVGKFEAKVRLDGGIVASLPFWVIPESAEDVETEKKRVEQAQIDAREAERKALEEEQAKFAAATAAAEPKPEEGEEGKSEEPEPSESEG